MPTKQQEILRRLLEKSGEKVEEKKLNEVILDIESLDSKPRVEELELIIKHRFPGFKDDLLTVDNSDLDGLLGTLGTNKEIG